MIRITEDVIYIAGLFSENLSADKIVLETWKSADLIKSM